MSNESDHELETLAALYALGHLHGEERAAFEAALQDEQSSAAAYLGAFQPVATALSWGVAKEPAPELRSRLLERVRHEQPSLPATGRITLTPGVLLVLADKIGWKETPVPGMRYKPLFIDHQRRYASSLVTMAPGATCPRHRHAQVEELFMLAGDMQVGAYRLQPGDYCRAEAGTLHEPIHSPQGCTFIALASLDDDYKPADADAASTPMTPPSDPALP